MNDVYVFDACSLIALLSNEDGADIAKSNRRQDNNSNAQNKFSRSLLLYSQKA
ncbi:hypothetical protein FACS1894172_21190 [Spirochaetia bacterium]|nr:hypothetical protein FACS1894164_08010 [Spirochaetia bacterium]GHU37664.1 hypothetical protein FACS1894172_21190 [Spirochaetia bacterium]